MIRFFLYSFISLFFLTVSSSQSLIRIEDEAVCTIKKLNILGRSNVSSFNLQYEEGGCLPIGIPNELKNDSVTVHIPVSCIKSNNKMMEKDMHQMLKVDSFPSIIIEVPEPKNWEIKALQKSSVVHLCMIITGIKNCFRVPLYIEENLRDLLSVNGEVKFNLTEFGISPPEKFLGLIKVKNEVIISFELEFMPKPAKL